MRRGVTAVIALLAIGLVVTSAQARKHHRAKGPAGVKGVVLDATCYGPCAVPAPPQPVYTGAVTIEVRRPSDGAMVASQAISDGHFRIGLAPGSYQVASVPPNPTPQPAPQPCPPGEFCPLAGSAQPAAIIACMTGETQPVQIHRHRFAEVTLHVRNTCIV
jgi:hypothetical protein